MPVEIRELVIKTNISAPDARREDAAMAEKMALLKQQIVQECIKTLKRKAKQPGFDR